MLWLANLRPTSMVGSMDPKLDSAGNDAAPPAFVPDVTCDACGAFGAFEFADQKLCQSCYTERGSCCAEFGGHDLCARHD